MAGINRERIRKQIQRAIQKLPENIVLMRIEKVGYDYDYEMKEVRVAEMDCFLDKQSERLDSKEDLSSEHGNIVKTIEMKLIAVWSESFDFKKDDFFFIKGVKHRIQQVKNNYDIYWECTVEVLVNG